MKIDRVGISKSIEVICRFFIMFWIAWNIGDTEAFSNIQELVIGILVVIWVLLPIFDLYNNYLKEEKQDE